MHYTNKHYGIKWKLYNNQIIWNFSNKYNEIFYKGVIDIHSISSFLNNLQTFIINFYPYEYIFSHYRFWTFLTCDDAKKEVAKHSNSFEHIPNHLQMALDQRVSLFIIYKYLIKPEYKNLRYV